MQHRANKASQLSVERIDHMSIVIDTKAAKWRPRNGEARFLSVKASQGRDVPLVAAFKAASAAHRDAIRRSDSTTRTSRPSEAPRALVDVSKASPLLKAFKAASAAHRAKHGV